MNLFLTTANKGGTLKTTFTALLADWAAHHGRHAVLVDAEDSALQESAASIARTSRIPAFRFPLDSVLPDSLDPGAWKGAPVQQAVPVFPRDATRLPALSFTRANLGDRDKAWAHLLNNLAYLGFDNDMDFFVDTGASQLDTLINKLPLLEMARRKGLNIVIVFMICTNDDSAAAAISYLNAFGQLGLHLRTLFVLTSDHNDGREEYSFTREKCIGTALEKYPGTCRRLFSACCRGLSMISSSTSASCPDVFSTTLALRSEHGWNSSCSLPARLTVSPGACSLRPTQELLHDLERHSFQDAPCEVSRQAFATRQAADRDRGAAPAALCPPR